MATCMQSSSSVAFIPTDSLIFFLETRTDIENVDSPCAIKESGDGFSCGQLDDGLQNIAPLTISLHMSGN
jgi:hypothetical protein